MEQTNTIKKTTFNTSTDFSSSLNENQYNCVLNYLNENLGDPDLTKINYKIWLVQNIRDEIFEIRLYNDEITINFKSNVVNSLVGPKIEIIINHISEIIKKN